MTDQHPAVTDTGPDRVYDPSNPEHRSWWREKVRQQILDACDLPEGLTLAWDEAESFDERIQHTKADEDAEKRATANRRYWSGPDKFDRQILRGYRVKFRHIGLAPRSVLDDRYRRRQINRRRRQ